MTNEPLSFLLWPATNGSPRTPSQVAHFEPRAMALLWSTLAVVREENMGASSDGVSNTEGLGFMVTRIIMTTFVSGSACSDVAVCSGICGGIVGTMSSFWQISDECLCAAMRVASRLAITDDIAFETDLAAALAICSGVALCRRSCWYMAGHGS